MIYTDQKPNPNAKAIELPELNIAEPRRPAASRPPEVEFDEPTAEPLSIVSPANQENVWGSGGTLDVQLSSASEIGPGMNVVIILDGEEYNAGRSLSVSIDGVERGEHKLRAELQTSSGRVLSRSEQVVFHMKQFSSNSPRSRNRRGR